MTIDTSDIRSNLNDQIVNCAKVINRSIDRRKVFEEIHRGKRKIKSVDEIVERTGLDRIRVLQEANYLANHNIIKKRKINKKLHYEKDPFFSQHKKKILSLAGNEKAIRKIPTKSNPNLTEINVKVSIPKKQFSVRQLTIDDIDSFKKVKDVELNEDAENQPILEKKFKFGLQEILGERGDFTDWGGENDDLYSNRLVVKDTRISTSFGLKGRGTKGKLTPKKMGKNGDQIQRLFRMPAEVFIVQYWNQIDQSVIEQMNAFAIMKSTIEGKTIYYGVIDGQDTLRIIKAYPEFFD